MKTIVITLAVITFWLLAVLFTLALCRAAAIPTPDPAPDPAPDPDPDPRPELDPEPAPDSSFIILHS